MKPHNQKKLDELRQSLTDAEGGAEALLKILDALPPDHSEFHSLHRHIKGIFLRLNRELTDFICDVAEFEYDFIEREPQWLKDRKAEWEIEREELQQALSKAKADA